MNAELIKRFEDDIHVLERELHAAGFVEHLRRLRERETLDAK